MEIQAAVNHKIEFPGHPMVHHFAENMLRRIDELEKEHPFLQFDREKAYFANLAGGVMQK